MRFMRFLHVAFLQISTKFFVFFLPTLLNADVLNSLNKV